MNEQLEQRAASILELLRQQPERGADLLIDFSKQYAANPQLEDEAILAKLKWMMAPEAADKAAALQQLEALTQRVVRDYNPAALSAMRAKENALTERMKILPVPNALVLQASGLRKRYASSKFSLELAKLELRLGEITGLVGENATGKTTLFRILAGELAADAGELRYPLFSSKPKPFWPQLKTRIAYVPQELSPWLGSLSENLSLEAVQHGLKGEENQKAVDYIVQRLGLAPHLDKTWAELSGGYKLRFALAKALIWNPQLLIIDEPLAYLDVKTQLIVLTDLKNLARSLRHPLAILLSSQHLHEVEAVADHMLFMRNGQVENLGRSQDWGKSRKFNVFEFGSTLDYSALTAALQGLAYHKLWHNGLNWLLSTDLSVSSQDFLQFLSQQQMVITYFRDISLSVKTRFYEEYI